MGTDSSPALLPAARHSPWHAQLRLHWGLGRGLSREGVRSGRGPCRHVACVGRRRVVAAEAPWRRRTVVR